jgi:excisionase family DNA binding protein
MDAERFMTIPRYAYSIDEAARSISITRRTFYSLISAGTVRTVKIGARRVVPVAELERLLHPQESP